MAKSKHNMWQWPNIGAASSNKHAPADSFEGREFHKGIINLIREAIQNTLDATDSNHHARINFKYFEPFRNCSAYFEDLKDFIKISNQKNENPKEISDSEYKEPDFILIQDFGTGGISGKLDDERDSPIWNFLLDWGQSNKQGSGNLGSKGQGRQSFLHASRIQTIFLLTFKETRRILSGLAFLNPYQKDNLMFDAQAVFAKGERDVVYDLHSGNEEVETQEEEWFINKFEHCFQIDTDTSNTGTAIVIPLPRKRVKESFHDFAIASVIENFAPAVLQNDLEVEVDGLKIDSSNIHNLSVEKKEFFSSQISKRFKNYAPNFILFLSKTLEILKNDQPDITIEYDAGDLVEFHEDTFTEEHKQIIRSVLQSEEIATVRFKFKIKRKNKHNNNFDWVDSYVDAAIGKCLPGQGIEMYTRSGMCMPKQELMIKGKYHAVMLCNEENISDLLNATEDTGHTYWNFRSSNIQKQGFDQDSSELIVRLCETALGDIVTSCLEESAVEDVDALNHLFMFDLSEVEGQSSDPEESDPEENPDDDNPDDEDGWDDDDEIERKKIFYSINQIESGFSVIHKNNALIGKEIILEPAYAQDPSTGRKSSGNNYDFTIDQINLEASNCNATQVIGIGGDLRINVTDMQDGFSLKVSNFNRNLEVALKHKVIWSEE